MATGDDGLIHIRESDLTRFDSSLRDNAQGIARVERLIAGLNVQMAEKYVTKQEMKEAFLDAGVKMQERIDSKVAGLVTEIGSSLRTLKTIFATASALLGLVLAGATVWIAYQALHAVPHP